MKIQRHKIPTFAVFAFIFACLAVVCRAGDLQLSVETLGAVKHADFAGKPLYGAGADVALKFNKFVTAHVRALAYETDNWGGGAIDEGSLLVEARLLSSANGKISLSAIGGGHHDFGRGDWGFGIGAKVAANIYGPLSIFAQDEVRAWFNGPKDNLATAGLEFSF